MNNEEYTLIQHQLLLLAGVCREMKLKEFLDRISISETIAPIFDPTLYLSGMDNLEQIKKLAQSLLPFQQEIRRQIKESQTKLTTKGNSMPSVPSVTKKEP